MASEKGKPAQRTWGGRFESKYDAAAQEFTASIGFDIRLYPYDIRGSIAHATMLAECGILTKKDRNAIHRALREIGKELDSGEFVPVVTDEDIHMAIERRLIEKIGAVGAKLHAARSRNDQVITDVRLFTKDAISAIDEAAADLQRTFVEISAEHPEAVLPGYTHLQRAQPVLLAHHLLAYHDMIGRDRERLADCLKRVDVLPLGAGALAGTTLPIDRKITAKELGFSRIAENSMDAVADRDFIAELLSLVAIIFSHISRLANEITLWATSEFGFVRLHDSFSTGSSMMPQKKNPDIAELVRGKSGRVLGNLVSLLTTVKGLPLAYNSDLQEDKEPLFDSVDTAVGSLRLTAALMRSLTFQEEPMRAAASDPLLLATDVAEFLVDEGVPFRDAHEITGKIVRHCSDRGTPLNELTRDQLRKFHPAFRQDAAVFLDLDRSIARRKSQGGTGTKQVRARIRKLSRRYGITAPGGQS